MGYADEKKCRCTESMCWLALCFCGLCCVTFVVFLFICSMLFPTFESDPQLGPLIAYPSNRIVFNMNDIRNSTEFYIEALRNITAEYGCSDEDDCSDERSECNFNATSHLGSACSPDANFGYLNRQPCVLLHLSRLSENFPPTSWKKWPPHLPVDCQGLRRVDHGRMRKYQVFPERGFASDYYTTIVVEKQNVTTTTTCDRRRHPATLVAVHFPDLTTGTNITITCSVSIPNAHELRRPSVTFSIEIAS